MSSDLEQQAAARQLRALGYIWPADAVAVESYPGQVRISRENWDATACECREIQRVHSFERRGKLAQLEDQVKAATRAYQDGSWDVAADFLRQAHGLSEALLREFEEAAYGQRRRTA